MSLSIRWSGAVAGTGKLQNLQIAPKKHLAQKWSGACKPMNGQRKTQTTMYIDGVCRIYYKLQTSRAVGEGVIVTREIIRPPLRKSCVNLTPAKKAESEKGGNKGDPPKLRKNKKG